MTKQEKARARQMRRERARQEVQAKTCIHGVPLNDTCQRCHEWMNKPTFKQSLTVQPVEKTGPE